MVEMGEPPSIPETRRQGTASSLARVVEPVRTRSRSALRAESYLIRHVVILPRGLENGTALSASDVAAKATISRDPCFNQSLGADISRKGVDRIRPIGSATIRLQVRRVEQGSLQAVGRRRLRLSVADFGSEDALWAMPAMPNCPRYWNGTWG